MILIDASALVAICDKGQGTDHLKFASAVEGIRGEIVTTLPCLTEAMYFMGKLAGWYGQEVLWHFAMSGTVEVYDLSRRDLGRMQKLMDKYSDTPMDFADASLVVAAEELKTSKILTADSDFTIYRINGKTSFEIIP